MLSGRETLGHLSQSLKSARRDLKRLDSDLDESSQAVAMNRRQQAQALSHLADMRLDAVRRGDIVEKLDSTDREVKAVLEERRSAVATLGERIRGADSELDDLEGQRESLHTEVDRTAMVLAEREAAVQHMLEEDAAFQSQLERTRKADAIAVSAAEKAELAAADRRTKGQPFEADELFMYLWQRRYGTSEYRANPLARLLDGWVARLCAYQQARPNYWMLLEIPKRLRDHAGRARDEADRELDQLQELEEQAARKGDVPAARSDLADVEQRQDAIDEKIQSTETQLSDLLIEQGRYSAGDDDYINRCRRLFADAMKQKNISDLTRLALGTMTAEDDTLVDELHQLRAQDDELVVELRENRNRQHEHMRRVRELEKVRRDFKSNRYDDLRSGFDNGEMIVRTIGEVLGGVIRGATLWDILRRYQRYSRAAGEWPDFGSGSITRRRRSGTSRAPTWHRPGPRRSGGGGGFRMPSAPRGKSRGRGGFRTGGGF